MPNLDATVPKIGLCLRNRIRSKVENRGGEHGFGGGPQVKWESTTSVEQGAFGVDVRNRDGLIALSDMRTGLWLFRMDGFRGWKGSDAGMPNISSVQDWDRGPKGQ